MGTDLAICVLLEGSALASVLDEGVGVLVRGLEMKGRTGSWVECSRQFKFNAVEGKF